MNEVRRIKRLERAYWLVCELTKLDQPSKQGLDRSRALMRLLSYIRGLK
jgi:hypothetical protein